MTLVELLDRCHRDELEPLAELIGVPARKLGLRDLSRAIEDKLPKGVKLIDPWRRAYVYEFDSNSPYVCSVYSHGAKLMIKENNVPRLFTEDNIRAGKQ